MFFRIRFPNCKCSIVWNSFITNNYFNVTYAFILRLLKMAENQTMLQVWTFYSPRYTNLVKFNEECELCTENHAFVNKKKMFTNGLNIALPLRAQDEKTVNGVEIHWLSSKEKVPGTAISKEDHNENFWDMKGPIDLLEKGATVNSVSDCQLLRQYFTLFIDFVWSLHLMAYQPSLVI